MKAAGNFQILTDSQFRIGMWAFHQITHLCPGHPAAEPDALVQDRGDPGAWPDHTQEHSDGGCFSSPVQTQEGIDLTFPNPQGEVIDRGHSTIALAQVLSFDRPIHNPILLLT